MRRLWVHGLILMLQVLVPGPVAQAQEQSPVVAAPDDQPPTVDILERSPDGSTPPRPYVLQSAARQPTSRLLVSDALETFDVQVDLTAVAENPETLTIDLPHTGLLEAVRTDFVAYRPDWKSWSGTLRYVGATRPGTGYINLGVHGNVLSALIDFEGERYRIVTEPDGKSQSLVRLAKEAGRLPCGMTDNLEGDVPQLLLAPNEASTEGVPLAVAADTVECPATTVRIDVLVVYPQEFFTTANAYAESQIRPLAEQAIQQANDIFSRSRIRAAYNLVGVVPLIGAQQPPAQIYQALDWMTTTGGTQHDTAPEVAALRNAFAADVVVMYIPSQWSPVTCGVGNMPVPAGGYVTGHGLVTPGAGWSPWNGRAFSVNTLGCGFSDFTFAHEIGHNYGLDHNENQADYYTGALLFSIGRGFLLPPPPETPTQATLMACAWNGSSCNRIPYFSDPEQDLSRPAELQQAGAIGDDQHNDRAIACIQVEPYSRLQDPPTTNQPPIPSFTVSCSQMTCTFDGRGSHDNQTSIQTWSWDFGYDGSIRTGNIVSYTYPFADTFRVHLVVTDSQGQTAVSSQTITILSQSYAPTGWVDGYNQQYVWGWACDPDYPFQSNRVDIYTTSGQYLGRADANQTSDDSIKSICRGGSAHRFAFYHNGGIAPGTHFRVWSIDRPYGTPGNDNRQIGGSGSIGDGYEFVMPVSQLYVPTGWVDGYNRQHIWGWACDPDYPTQSNRVDIYNMSWQFKGSATANKPSSAPINSICRGGSAHYFDFYHNGSIAPGTHFMVWSIDLPYGTSGNVNRRIGGSGSIGDGYEFVMP